MNATALISLLLTSYQVLFLNDWGSQSEEFINTLNRAENLWIAGKNFNGKLPPSYFRRQYGVLKHPKGLTLPMKETDNSSVKIPKSYDARDAYPYCPSLNEINEQGYCASDWAFGAAESMSDRYCIKSNGTVLFHVSADDLLTCCTDCGNGCNGGFAANAWKYWVENGIVSGGSYGSHEGCRPYEIHPNGLEHINTPNCVKKCESFYNVTYENDLHYGINAYSINLKVEDIQREILQNGPVQATMAIFFDFVDYSRGIYKHIYGIPLGYSSVRIFGWGTENGRDFWLGANSWGTDWGEDGFFKILRGVNECEIESHINAGLPKIQ